jgi:hypothetical protein
MKKLTILICVLAMLLAFTGVASASPEQPTGFRIEGETTAFLPLRTGSDECTVWLASRGDTTGDIEGTFRMSEYLHFNTKCRDLIRDYLESGHMPEPEAIDGKLTILPEKRGWVRIGFAGETYEGVTRVQGDFWVIRGTGFYRHLEGEGTYDGTVDDCTIDPDTFELVCDGFYADFIFDD